MTMTDESKTMTDLVERLRKRKAFGLFGSRWMMLTDPDEDCSKAADALEAQAKEISVIRSNYETAQANWDLTLDRAEKAETQLSTIRRETLEEAIAIDTLYSLLSSPVHAGEGGTTTSSLPGSLTTGDQRVESSVSGEGEGGCPMCPPGQCNSSGYPDDPCFAPQGGAPTGLSYDERSLINRIKSKYKDAPTWADTDRLLAIIDRLSASPPPAKGVTEDEMVTLILREWMAGGESYSVWEGGSRGFWAKLAARAVLRVLASSIEPQRPSRMALSGAGQGGEAPPALQDKGGV